MLRFLLYNISGTLIEKLFYWPGWVLLRIITVGHYPPARGAPHYRHAVALLAAVGTANGLLLTLT